MKHLVLYGMVCLLCLIPYNTIHAQKQTDSPSLENYTVRWTSQSKNSSESMPCGGGDTGLNVWVENNDILFYFSRSGTFDENNAFLKLGRIRLRLSPNPFATERFEQTLTLQDGSVRIKGEGTTATCWVDVFHPVIHVEVQSKTPVSAEVFYENWRTKDFAAKGEDAHFCGLKGTPVDIYIHPDSISFEQNQILFYHRNKNDFAFNKTVEIEELEDIKSQLWNPVKNRTFGGILQADGFVPNGTEEGRYVNTDYKAWKLKSAQPRKQHQLAIYLHTQQAEHFTDWYAQLKQLQTKQNKTIKQDRKATLNWWKEFWNRSFIFLSSQTDSIAFQIGRNYQLFRYMLACNAYGDSPTKFNGGLFTFDPSFVKGGFTRHTPDFRNWGGAVATAQNQRLVYWPMLKSGDFDMMDAEFNFYLRAQKNAELMTQSYWGHQGACFTEQIENFGLPAAYAYGLKRPQDYPRGLQYNAYVEYQWDTVFEFCLMMLDTQTYEGRDISSYIPFIESCLTFYDEHYRMLASQRTPKIFDREGHYVLYPGTACETYKMATNSAPTVAALTTVLKRLLQLPGEYLSIEQRNHWKEMLSHIPPLYFREMNGHKTISPAKSWERLSNVELPQLYPVYPYGMYGIGLPDLDVAINTWKYGADQEIQKNRHESWHQDPIFCARLGLTDDAKRLTILKLQDAKKRFPAFWGPGHDWTPDHNWGGSGMIALQEMLMQTVGEKIYLFPAWPMEWDVHFKLHAPQQTTIEVTLKDGKVEQLDVYPQERAKDIILYKGSAK